MTVTMRVGETQFQLIENLGHMASLRDEDGMVLSKTIDAVDKLRDLLATEKIVNVLDVGIHRGGSVAFFAEFLNPSRLAAIDIISSAPMLENWIDRREQRGTVQAFYEVDQADAARLRAIHAEFFAGEPIDLADDDASHELDRTRATFNAIFPLMREDGLYIIEDWAWHEQTRDFTGIRPPRFRDEPPLSGLIMEIMTASARKPGLTKEILVNNSFVAIRRGPFALGENFDVRDFA